MKMSQNGLDKKSKIVGIAVTVTLLIKLQKQPNHNDLMQKEPVPM